MLEINKKNLNNFIYDLSNNFKKLLIIYFIYISIIALNAFIFAHLFSLKFSVMDDNSNIILKNISFEFGELIENLYFSRGYFHEVDGVKHYLKKLPVIPFLILMISKLTLNYYLVVIIKNIIIFSIYFFTTFYLLKNLFSNKFILLILMAPLFVPYNFSVALNYVYADCVIAIFLPLLYLSLISKAKHKIIIFSLILSVLYLSKATMFFMVVSLPILVFIFEKNYSFFNKTIPFIVLTIAISAWGFFGLVKTGKFPIGKNILSYSSVGLSTVLNEDFKNYYPNKSVDLITNQLSNERFDSEWDQYRYYDLRNKKYLRDNFMSYLKDCMLKIKFIFFGVHKDGKFPDKDNNLINELMISMIFNKFFLNLAIIICLLILIKNYKKIFSIKDNFYFLAIVTLSLLPHIIVWATSKHLIGVINLSIIYLLIFFQNIMQKKNDYF